MHDRAIASEPAFRLSLLRDRIWEIYLMTVPPAGSQGPGTDLINLTKNPANDELPFWRRGRRGGAAS